MTTIDRARLAIPLLQAIVEGKTLQYLRDGEEGDPWIDDPPEKQDECTFRGVVENPQNWRIKPQPREWWICMDKQTGFNPTLNGMPVETDERRREVVHVREVTP